MALSHTAHQQVATGRCRSAWRELRQLRRLQRAAPQQSTIQCSSTAVCSPVTEPTRSPSPTQTLQPQAPALRSPQALEVSFSQSSREAPQAAAGTQRFEATRFLLQDALPIFVALEHDLFTAKGTLGYEEVSVLAMLTGQRTDELEYCPFVGWHFQLLLEASALTA